jgi:hypothetical protein
VATFLLGKVTSEALDETTYRIPIGLEAPTAVSSLAVVLRYDPAALGTVTCQASTGTEFDMGLCSVDAATGTVRFSALAATGKRGRLAVGEVNLHLPERTINSSSELMGFAPLTVEALALTDPNGATVSALVRSEALNSQLYLPFVVR